MKVNCLWAVSLVFLFTVFAHGSNEPERPDWCAMNDERPKTAEERVQSLREDADWIEMQCKDLVVNMQEKLDVFREHLRETFAFAEHQKKVILQEFVPEYAEYQKRAILEALVTQYSDACKAIHEHSASHLQQYEKKLEKIWRNHRAKMREHDSQVESKRRTNRISGTIFASAQRPRFTLKDSIGPFSDELELLFALCARHTELELGDLPRGILFHGLPGTGKTFMAEVLAGEAQFLYFYQSAPCMHGEYAHDGTIYTKEYFADVRRQAKEAGKPAIITIDELDGVGLNRDTLGGGSAGAAMRNTLNQLMIELARPMAEGEQPVIVIGTTNCMQDLDPALKRTGRFDETIPFHLPNKQQYQKAIEHYKKRYKPCKDGAHFPISTDIILQHQFSLGDIDLIFKKTRNYAFVQRSPVATKQQYEKAFAYVLQKKQDELSRGLKHKRDELLQDLTLIKAAYPSGSGASLSRMGEKIVWKRLGKLFTTDQDWHEFWGQTKKELKGPSFFEQLFGECA